MFVVELIVDEKSGKMMALAVTKMERDPAVPHCTVLHLAQPAIREIPGQAALRFQTMSVRSEQINGWFEGEFAPPKVATKDADPATEKAPPSEPVPPDSPPSATPA